MMDQFPLFLIVMNYFKKMFQFETSFYLSSIFLISQKRIRKEIIRRNEKIIMNVKDALHEKQENKEMIHKAIMISDAIIEIL